MTARNAPFPLAGGEYRVIGNQLVSEGDAMPAAPSGDEPAADMQGAEPAADPVQATRGRRRNTTSED